MSVDDSLERFSIVPLRLRVETDPCPVKVRQILEWRPGTLFTLGQESRTGLNLSVGGVLVARGELLARGGRVGFQIANFASPPEPHRCAPGGQD